MKHGVEYTCWYIAAHTCRITDCICLPVRIFTQTEENFHFIYGVPVINNISFSYKLLATFNHILDYSTGTSSVPEEMGLALTSFFCNNRPLKYFSVLTLWKMFVIFKEMLFRIELLLTVAVSCKLGFFSIFEIMFKINDSAFWKAKQHFELLSQRTWRFFNSK